MLLCILIYAFITKQLPSTTHANPIVYPVIAFLAIWALAALLFFRRKLVKVSEKILAVSPDDAVAVRRWQTGYVIIYALSEAVALYGLVLHFLGFSPVQIAPFFAAGILPILVFAPKLPENP